MKMLMKLIKLLFDDGGPEDPVCQDNECQPW